MSNAEQPITSPPSHGLRNIPIADRISYRPQIFRGSDPETWQQLSELAQSGRLLSLDDTIEDQLRDLALTQLRNKHAPAREVELEIQRILDGVPVQEFGVWVYYPWRRQLVHLLPVDLFRKLRLDRNHHKITRREQAQLLGKCVGVVGLSVGSSALITMVLEGVAGHFKIADFDLLDLSNLNRLRASVTELRVSKAILAARAAFEVDPYLKIDVFEEGLNESNLADFLSDELDLLVEECDDLPMKVRLREAARKRRIPVVMETTDRGMIDIERFDLEPERPLFHGKLGDVRAEQLQHARTKDRVPFVLGILDPARLSTSMAASLVEIENTTYTWPQLASAVALGGALVTEATRKILLQAHSFSGRFYADLDQLIAPSADQSRSSPIPLRLSELPVAHEATLDRKCPPLPRSQEGELSNGEFRFLVRHASMAPSGGNTQPWRFRQLESTSTVVCSVDPERAHTFLDHEGWAAQLSLGAAVTNLVIAAESLGFEANVSSTPPSSSKAADLAGTGVRVQLVRRRTPQDHPLRQAVFERVTTRHKIAPAPLPDELARKLTDAAAQMELGLRLVLTREERRRIGHILGEGDRLRLQIQSYHKELISEIRWTPEETLNTRTGIDVASLEASPADRAALQVLRRWDVMDYLEREGMGTALGDNAREAVEACSGIALLSAPDPMSTFEAGRRLQHLWLLSTQLGLAWQPWAPLLAMHQRARSGDGLAESERRKLLTLGNRLEREWDCPDGHRPVFLFRLLHESPTPSAHALRLPVEAFVES